MSAFLTGLGLKLLPYVAQALTPALVALAKMLADAIGTRLPKKVVLLLAGVLGEVVNQLPELLVGASLPPGVSALVAVGMREFYDQFYQQARGFAMVLVLALAGLPMLSACGLGEGDGDGVTVNVNQNQGSDQQNTDAGNCNENPNQQNCQSQDQSG